MCDMARTPTTPRSVALAGGTDVPKKATPKKMTPKKKPAAKKPAAKKPTAKPIDADPMWIVEVVRKNVKLLKGLRDLSDEEITRRGRYTSRQVYHNRMNGPVDFSSEDFARIAAALDVEPGVLFLPPAQVVQWAEDHPDYKGPVYRQQSPRKGAEDTA